MNIYGCSVTIELRFCLNLIIQSLTLMHTLLKRIHNTKFQLFVAFLFFSNCISTTLSAQFCSGSLGDPIVNIDFGSGLSNPGPDLPTAVPGASSTYNFASYISSGQPPSVISDGDYALVNRVPNNHGWLTNSKDHTGDANGYMGFFNASSTPGDFYAQTVSNLCPGTTYEFAVWATNVIDKAIYPNAVAPNLTFKISDPNTNQLLGSYNTGNIDCDFSLIWHQYSFLFTLPNNISSVKLSISNNNIGGVGITGNDMALDDITFRPCGPKTTASFSPNSILSSTSITSCSSINLYGSVSAGLVSPAYQWQISFDNGLTFSNINGANSLNYSYYIKNSSNCVFRLISAESTNINNSPCRFYSNSISLTVTGNCGTPCNNWLKITDENAYFRTGDIDIPGTTITVEATFNRIQPYNGPYVYAGDLVSKHTDASDCNYLLRPGSAEITTTNGYYITPKICEFKLNKTYHVAMTYDGKTLKFYRNGFLMSQVAASGSLLQNDLITTIGNESNLAPSSNPPEFLWGYVNEVRIWNVVRTQAQINQYKDQSIPSPQSETGLVAYYTFDDLKNKKTNGTWDGSLMGTASINNINPNCTYIADSCNIPCFDSVKINYTKPDCENFTFTGVSYPSNMTVANWAWNFGDNSSAATQNSTHNYATPGNKTVTLTVTNSDGCSAKDIISVTANSKAQITKINDQAICHDKTIQLWVKGGLNYKWAPDNTLSNLNISNPVASPTKNTKYYVTITDANLCTYNDSVEIKVIPTPTFTVNSDTTLCPNTKLQLNATGGDSYLWSPASGVDNPTSATPYISAIQTATVYSVKIKTTQCNDSALLQTKVNISKDIKLSVSKSNDIDCKTGTATLKVTGADTYTWSPNSFIDNTEGSTTVCYPATTTKYYVKGTSADGCEGLDSVTVVVDFSDGEKTKYIPNAFSPNGDGLNDCFGVKRWGYAKVFRLTVYNRWGARVFYTEDPAKCWDGMYKGKQAEAGNYVTEVYAETNCGIVKMKGNLVLIR